MEKTLILKVQLKDEIGLSIDRWDPENVLKWNIVDHFRFVHNHHHDSNNDVGYVFMNTQVILHVEEACENLSKELSKIVTKDVDILLLDYNDLCDKIHDWIPDVVRKRIGTCDEVLMEDVSCYMITPAGCCKVIQLNMDGADGSAIESGWNLTVNKVVGFTGSKSDNWSVERYLDTESPILLCHLLRKWKGSAAGILARPKRGKKGWYNNWSWIYVMIFMVSFLWGFLGIPSEWLLRLICLMHIIEPLEGLIIKVVIILVMCKLLHAIGENPLFFI